MCVYMYGSNELHLESGVTGDEGFPGLSSGWCAGPRQAGVDSKTSGFLIPGSSSRRQRWGS